MKVTTVKYVCDICKIESESSDFNTGSESGLARISLKGHSGQKTYAGDWGGFNYDDTYEVCFRCADKVKDEILKLKEKSL